MKKIIYIVNVDWFFISHRIPIARAAIEEGYEVHLACKFTGSRKVLESYGIKCHNIDFCRNGGSLFKEFKSILQIKELLKSVKADIVHSVTIKPVIYTGLTLKLIKNPPAFVAAISGLGYVFSAKTIKAKATKFLVSLLYSLAFSIKNKMIIFQNTSDKDTLLSLVTIEEKYTVLIKGSGADLSIYKQSTEPDTRDVVVTMACRLLKEKGIYDFIDAARIIKSSYPSTKFQLVGGMDLGNPSSITEKEIERFTKEGVVEFLGQQRDIPLIFANSHIISLPSYYGEGVPKVLIEAAACGRPIVTTNNPGCRDAVIDGVTGILVPTRDPKALAIALDSLVSKPELRKQMGNRAREFAIAEFDVRDVVQRHLDIYKKL
ncbi:glycosyl transferase family 1 [Vibrio breoganii]|uniref:glycosyltransferase family 4 protein n=1 Tax=Vibrio breoganii TaxID=553239 RepID=UPI000C849D2C|nr:glycosyltransferase family 4 protein [Vibrio breoganii]PMO63055.1 glycosyl transferase family 1 [Vibrio breoganii]